MNLKSFNLHFEQQMQFDCHTKSGCYFQNQHHFFPIILTKISYSSRSVMYPMVTCCGAVKEKRKVNYKLMKKQNTSKHENKTEWDIFEICERVFMCVPARQWYRELWQACTPQWKITWSYNSCWLQMSSAFVLCLDFVQQIINLELLWRWFHKIQPRQITHLEFSYIIFNNIKCWYYKLSFPWEWPITFHHV